MSKKKLLIISIIIGLLVVSLLASAFAFGWFKKQEKPEVKTEQKTAIKTEEVKKSAPTESEKGKLSPEEGNAEDKAEISPEVRKILRDPHYVYEQTVASIKRVERELNGYRKHPDAFCQKLFEDFKANNNIEIIEPVVQTDDFEDEELQAYFKDCNERAPTKSGFNFKDLGFNELVRRHVAHEHGKTYITDWFPLSNFKLFDIDTDNNPDNGKQQLLYMGEVGKKISGTILRSQMSPTDGYRGIDFNKCEKTSVVVSARSPVNYKTMEPTGSYSGVIKYKNKYYVYKTTNNSEEGALPHMIIFRPLLKDESWKYYDKCTFYNKTDKEGEK